VAADVSVRVTVLTCTYNRAHTLPRLHRSLQQQIFRDFEWLIIDDGSTDGTAQLVAGWAGAPGEFPIRYFAKPNGGKHSAHNFALPLIRGEYCAIIDSDDWYPATALLDLVQAWQSIPKAEVSTFANVEGLAQTQDGKILGPPFPTDVFDSDNFSIVKARPGQDDTRGMHRTSVLREYPFPEGPGFEFVPEALVWCRIARRYRSRFINKVVGFAEYQPGGLSDRYFEHVLSSLAPNILLYREKLELSASLPVATRAKLCANYLRLAAHEGTLLRRLREAPRRGLAILMLPTAVLLFLRDRARGHVGRSGARAAPPQGAAR
jgi:glycosyltransferase involved in cell wall biosynthesis